MDFQNSKAYMSCLELLKKTVQVFHVGDDHGRMDQKDRNTMATINVVPSHNSAICGWILKIMVAMTPYFITQLSVDGF